MAKESAVDTLVRAFHEERPVILVLGQNAISSPSGLDPILQQLLTRLGKQDQPNAGWRTVLEGEGLSDEDYRWLTERFQRNVASSESVQQAFDAPWSAVFTSSIDPTIARRFESRGRQPESVLAKDQYARVPRSRSRPPIHYLFGRTDETNPNERPPRNSLELARRKAQHTAALLSRISQTATSLGIVAIDGFDGGGDWLAADELLAHLSQENGPQVVWFGDIPTESTFFPVMGEKGALTTHTRRLTAVVSELASKGALQIEGSAAPDEPGLVTISGDKAIYITPGLRLRVEASSSIVDDDWVSTLPPLEPTAREEAFRRFHGSSVSSRTIIEGIGRGFAITRDFEETLRSKVERVLQHPGDPNRLVVLHGQSGTGKTVAISRLAYSLRRELKVPVLYSWGRAPLATDVDDFCAEAERAEAEGTVILCDANQPAARYRDLASALLSRGRRVVVVGTSYRIEFPDDSAGSVVLAPPRLSQPEAQELITLLEAFGQKTPQVDDIVNDHFLALLYRMLSSGRERIAQGLSSEARAAELTIRTRAASLPMEEVRSALAEQLIAAGLHDGSVTLFEPGGEGEQYGADAAGQLIDYVMVAGRLNCPVPMNLVLRTVSDANPTLGLAQIGYLFNELDLFRWHMSDPEGSELLIGPRIQFEAELICRRRLADRNREAHLLEMLIKSVREDSVDRGPEIGFVLDLLHKLDREGPRRDAYAPYYLDIARALTQLREAHQVEHPSLMLQEAAFRRHALRWSDSAASGAFAYSADTKSGILNEARDVVELAIRKIQEGSFHVGRRTREHLRVERASIYGYLAVARTATNASADEIWSDYLAARTATSNAMGSVDSYFPFDIGLWTPADLLERAVLPLGQTAELRADIYAVLDQIDPDALPIEQRTRYEERRGKLAKTLGDEALGQDAYANLEQLNPTAAYFLAAREMCPEALGQATGPFEQSIREKAKLGADYLIARDAAISSDPRCLRLLLDYAWTASTGERVNRGERKPTPYNKQERAQILGIVRTLNESAGDGARAVHRYLEAVFEWLAGDFAVARDIWRSLARETEYEDSSRVIRRLFWADSSGKPLVFRGRVTRRRTEGHWRLKIDGEQREIDLIEREFRDAEIRVGREIREFAVAFNYLGPIADSLSRYGARQ